MLNKSIPFLVVLAVASLAAAQQKSQQQVATEGTSVHGNYTSTCKVTFSSGSGNTATQFCVTANGNIAQFSVAGQEMIAVGTIGEGYGFCALEVRVSYYDYAYTDSGNWDAPTFTQSGNVVTVTRLTSDGLWQLKQTITNIPATAAGPGSAKVTMALKNLSGVTVAVSLLRYADIDADSDPSGNDFDYTTFQTAYGLEPTGVGRGLSITNNTFKSGIFADGLAQDVFSGPDPCGDVSPASRPFHGDGSVLQFWEFASNKGSTTTVTSTYKPI